ncbi:MAG: hypothetical protein HQL23_07600 [Candidatus Omnitrophica bacterium]|nr:hypothetical protein [Candidatus Omnitrophota bacterium]
MNNKPAISAPVVLAAAALLGLGLLIFFLNRWITNQVKTVSEPAAIRVPLSGGKRETIPTTNLPVIIDKASVPARETVRRPDSLPRPAANPKVIYEPPAKSELLLQ